MFTRKIGSALKIFRTAGAAGIAQALLRNLGGSTEVHVDEADLAFRALQADRQPGVLVDVGAHFGHVAQPFCEAGWRVLAFEPDPANRARLQATLAPFSSAVIDPRAVSDHEQASVTFYRSDQSTGISGLSAFDQSHQASGTVAMTTLAVALREHGIGAVDLLKIDTEGFDKFVIDGFPADLPLPRVIVCEFEDHKTLPLGYDFHALAGQLQGRGYRVVVSEWHPIVRYGVAHEWHRFQTYPCELATPRAWGNLIAVRDDEVFQRLGVECRDLAARHRRVRRLFRPAAATG